MEAARALVIVLGWGTGCQVGSAQEGQGQCWGLQVPFGRQPEEIPPSACHWRGFVLPPPAAAAPSFAGSCLPFLWGCRLSDSGCVHQEAWLLAPSPSVLWGGQINRRGGCALPGALSPRTLDIHCVQFPTP